ncbi:MAG: M48 family metallopeptidase [Bacteriovoracia bacterium]
MTLGYVLIAWLIVDFLFELVVEALNLSNVRAEVPAEFRDLYPADKYARAQAYLRDTTRFGLVHRAILLAIFIAFWGWGGFERLDVWAREWGAAWGGGEVTVGLFYIGALAVASRVLRLPFAIYSTFVIEQRYGFNRTTPLTFAQDLVKGSILAALIGGVAVAGVLWFFERTGEWAWLYAWAALAVFQLLLVFIAPTWIMPLFNRFTPLPEGELKEKVHAFAAKHGFRMSGIFTMDGSKRSSKANAFFTGFGAAKRIVLFDTLIQKHTVDELVGVLAHEIGHYQLKHIFKMILISLGFSALSFYVVGLLMHDARLFAAFGIERVSVYGSLVALTILYGPLSRWISAFFSGLSRQHEFEADAYAAKTTQKPADLALALKKLSVENLSNLHPHSLKVFLEYSHPPILERLRKLSVQ